MGKAGWSEDSLLINNCVNQIHQISLKDKRAPQKNVRVNKMHSTCVVPSAEL